MIYNPVILVVSYDGLYLYLMSYFMLCDQLYLTIGYGN